MFPVPDYHPMHKRAVDMDFYDEYMDEECIIIVVHVTEDLTGNQFSPLGYTYLWDFILIKQ